MDKYTFAVATKAVIFNNKGEYLVIKKSSSEDINPNTYDIPGGRLEFGEDLENSVKREVMEETGLTIKPLTVFNAWTFTKDKFQLTGVDFLSEYTSGDIKLSDEHDEVVWLTSNDINKMTELPSWLVKTIKKAESLRKLLATKNIGN